MLKPITGLLCLLPSLSWAAGFDFDRVYMDLEYGGNGRPGWVRAGDMDGDGDLDIVAGGGYALFVYENMGAAERWRRHGSLDGTRRIGANGAVLYDVDGDGDLDVVCAKYKSDLGWWENPGGRLGDDHWPFHAIRDVPWLLSLFGGAPWYLHDMILTDLDGDGRKNTIVANLTEGNVLRVQWLRPGADPSEPWQSVLIEDGRDHGQNNHAGLDVGDVDGDGDIDLAYSNGWYESTDPEHGGRHWSWHPVTNIYGISNALLRDMDGDGDLDLVMSAGHHGKGLFWLENSGQTRTGDWTVHVIDGALLHPECLAVLDLDHDGDFDIVTCNLDFDRWDEQVHNVYVFENEGSRDSGHWTRHAIAPDSYPSHLLQMVDMNADGAVDIISEATGYSVISYYRNRSQQGK